MNTVRDLLLVLLAPATHEGFLSSRPRRSSNLPACCILLTLFTAAALAPLVPFAFLTAGEAEPEPDPNPDVTPTPSPVETLLDAIDSNQVTTVAAILDVHPEFLNQRFESGQMVSLGQVITPYSYTLLHNAIWAGKMDVIKLLVERGADLNAREWRGCSPLLLTAERFTADDVSYFLDHGSNLLDRDNYGQSALHYALANEHGLDVVKVLCAHGIPVDIARNDGVTPLMLVTGTPSPAHYAVDAMVKYLLDNGAQICAADKYGDTLLHWAVLGDNLDMAERCLAADVDLNAVNRDGDSALDITLHASDSHSVVGMDPIGPIPAAKVGKGSPMGLTLNESPGKVFTWLVEHGARSGQQDHGGQPFLIETVQGYRIFPGAIRCLLEHGWDPNVHEKESFRGSLLHYLALCDQRDLAMLALEHHADLNAVNYNGDTPLHLAAHCYNKPMCVLLLQHGASVWQKNDAGHTALQEILNDWPWHGLSLRFLLLNYNEDNPGAAASTIRFLYAAQETPVNVGLWLAFLIVIPGAWTFTRRRKNRRAAAAIATPDADPLANAPDHIFADAQWQHRAVDFLHAKSLHDAAVQYRRALITPMLCWSLVLLIEWLDPVLWAMSERHTWITLGLITLGLAAAYAAMYIRSYTLRPAAAFVGFCVGEIAAIVTLMDGYFMAVSTGFVFVGVLLLACALTLLLSMWQFYRLLKAQAALGKMHLPFHFDATPKPAEAEEIGDIAGWDQASKKT